MHTADARVTTEKYHVRWQIPCRLKIENEATSIKVNKVKPPKNFELTSLHFGLNITTTLNKTQIQKVIIFYASYSRPAGHALLAVCS